MPTTPDSLKGLVAISTDSKIKPLGYVAWFSVPDDSVSLRKLKMTLAAHGLSPALAPEDTKAVHTFKRAMREQEGRHRENGHYIENEVAQVDETGDDVVYQISSLKRDLQERVIDYAKGMRVIFNKRTEEIHFNVLGDVHRSELLPIMESITDFMEKNAAKVTGARVRTVVRNFLRSESDEGRNVEGLSGENLRGKAGGVYFVLAQYGDKLAAMSDMLEELYKGKAYLHAIPMADGATEREMIRRHHVANTREEMKQAMGEVRELLSGDRDRAPRSDVVANKWAHFHQIERRAAKYAAALADEQDEINDMAVILKKQLDKLVG